MTGHEAVRRCWSHYDLSDQALLERLVTYLTMHGVVPFRVSEPLQQIIADEIGLNKFEEFDHERGNDQAASRLA